MLPDDEYREKNATTAKETDNCSRVPSIFDTAPLKCEKYHDYTWTEHGKTCEIELGLQELRDGFICRSAMVRNLDEENQNSTNGADW